jgi:hypothetical protein
MGRPTIATTLVRLRDVAPGDVVRYPDGSGWFEVVEVRQQGAAVCLYSRPGPTGVPEVWWGGSAVHGQALDLVAVQVEVR